MQQLSNYNLLQNKFFLWSWKINPWNPSNWIERDGLFRLKELLNYILRIFCVCSIKVCNFYRFFWKTIFFVFLNFLCFLPVLCRIRCKLFKHFALHDHCLHSSRCQGLCVLCFCSHLFEPFVKIDTRHKNLSIALNKNMSLESIWAFNF